MDPDREDIEQFTDEELALRRRGRFGELPAWVVPDDQIETKETPAPPLRSRTTYDGNAF